MLARDDYPPAISARCGQCDGVWTTDQLTGRVQRIITGAAYRALWEGHDIPISQWLEPCKENSS